jgi:serine/threonine protein phosphatase 1
MSWWRKLVRPTFQLPPNQVIYAIGDIHGRLDLLKEMHALIVEDAKKYEGRDLMIVYLGDYVDRGPDVSGVLDVLVNGPPDGFTGVYIKGNHEQMLLDFLSDARVGQAWFDAAIGGFATIESYGVAFPKYVTELDPVQAELKAKLPDYHLEFLQDLPTHFECGDYYFVHAGIHPNRPVN